MSSAIKEPEAVAKQQTRFYVVAEITCPDCKGVGRASKRRRRGEPDYCTLCGGHGYTGNRIDLKDALRELGVAIHTSTETNGESPAP